MINITILTEEHLEDITGGNGWPMWVNTTSTSSVFSVASYKNALRQSNYSSNVVFGGGRNSFAGITSGAMNVSEQGILS